VALVLVVALGAFVVGRLGGGTLPRLRSVPLRGVRLLLVTALLLTGGALLAGVLPGAYAVASALSVPFLLLFLLRNRRVVGVPLVAVGLAAHVAVVVANGAAPVSADAVTRAGSPDAARAVAEDPRREPLTDATRLPWLADRLPVALPGLPGTAGLADVLVAAGVGLFVVGGMNRARPGRPAAAPWDSWPRPGGRVPAHRTDVPEPPSHVRAPG
jgi:hypothetical protein